MEVEEKIIRPRSYIILVAYKFLVGITEVCIGAAFGLFGKQFLRFYEFFELSHAREDPNLYIRTIERAIPFLLDHSTYVVVFFLTFGTAKIIGAVGLWFERMWAIHLMIILSAMMLPFEIIDFLRRPSIFLVFYIAANFAIVIYLLHFNPHIRRIRHKYHLKGKAHDDQKT